MTSPEFRSSHIPSEIAFPGQVGNTQRRQIIEGLNWTPLVMTGTTVEGETKEFCGIEDYAFDLSIKKDYERARAYIAYCKLDLGFDVRFGPPLESGHSVENATLPSRLGFYVERDAAAIASLTMRMQNPWFENGESPTDPNYTKKFIDLYRKAQNILPDKKILRSYWNKNT